MITNKVEAIILVGEATMSPRARCLAFTVLFSLSLLCLLPTYAAEFDYPPETCPDPARPHYSANIAHTVQGGQLLLIDTNTNAPIAVLDNAVLTYRRYHIYWASNCRYLIAMNIYTPYEPYPRRFTSVYDTLTGARIFQSGREIWFGFIPSPAGSQFLIKSVRGMFLMNESLSEPVLLFNRHRFGSFMRYWEWDMARGQLLVNFEENSGYLMIYDINTGATIAAISHPEVCSPTGVFYSKSADTRYLLVYTFRGNPACVTVYDHDTNTVVAQVNDDSRTAGEAEQFALSPDGRYLVVGMRALRVWDLDNLPEHFEDRLPIYRHEGPIAVIQSLRFITNEILETTSPDGVQQWNILTGEQITP
jgi:hypothetical protein